MAIRTGVEKPGTFVEDDKLGADSLKGIRLVIDVRQMADDLFVAIWVLELICIVAYLLAFLMKDKSNES